MHASYQGRYRRQKWYEYTLSEYGLHNLAHDRGDLLDVGIDGFSRQGCRFYVNP